MRQIRRWVVAAAVVGGTTALSGFGSAPAAAQTADPPSGPPGSTTTVSFTCAFFGDELSVELVGTGGSVHRPAPSTSAFSFAAEVVVPWSTAPGPATIAPACPTPPTPPFAFTVTAPPVPAAPGDLAAVPGDDHVGVSWTAPPGDRAWVYSVVTLRDGLFDNWVNVPGYLTAAAVPAVDDAEVDVYVAATNRYGFGAFAGPVGVTPSATAPARLPPTVALGNTLIWSNGSVSMNWEPVADPHRTPAVAYEVAAVRASDGAEVATHYVGADLRHASVGTLAADDYTMIVRPLDVTGAGVGDSDAIQVPPPMHPPTPSGPSVPQDISVQHGAGGLSVTWRPSEVDDGFPISGYSVVVRELDVFGNPGSALGWQVTGPHARQAAFPNLHLPLPRVAVEVYGYNGAFGRPRTTFTGG